MDAIPVKWGMSKSFALLPEVPARPCMVTEFNETVMHHEIYI